MNHSIFWTNLCSPKSFVDVNAASPEVHKQKQKRQKRQLKKKTKKFFADVSASRLRSALILRIATQNKV